MGPLLMGISKPFNVLHRATDMENVVNVIAITVAQDQDTERKRRDLKKDILLDLRLICNKKPNN